jgi:hypothetical protein
MEFVCYKNWNKLPQDANEFFALAGKESIFFSQPWFNNLVTHGLDEDQSIVLACVLKQGRLVALLPLDKQSSTHYHSLTHLYTSLSTLLLANHDQEAIIDCLVTGLRKLPVEFLQISPIADNNPNLLLLQERLENSGYTCQRHFQFYNWFHRTNGETFAEYMSARPSRVRNTIDRKMRKLQREHGYNIRLFTHKNLRQGIVDYNSVYTTSWKAEEQFVGFVEGLAEQLFNQGWLRLAVLYIGDVPAAAQFWVVANGKASIFKLVYDQFWKKYSPGTILTAYLMRHVIKVDKVDEIDFLTGNDAYKQEWMSQRRERYRLSCYIPAAPKSWPNRLKQKVSTMLKS